MNGTIASRTLATGLMAIWTIAGVILAGNLPVLGAVIMAFAGLPALLVVLAWGGAWFCMYGTITLLATFFWGGALPSLVLVPLLLFPALTLAWTIGRLATPMQAIGAALIISTVASGVLWGVSPLFGTFGTELWSLGDQFRQQGKTAETQLQAMEKQGEVDREKLELFLEQFREWVSFVSLLIPLTFLFLWHLISLGIFYLGAMAAAPHLGFTIPPLPKFSTWQFNWHLIWIMFAGWFLFYGAGSIDPGAFGSVIRYTGANLLAVSKILFFVSGFSLLFYFFEFYQLSHPVRFGFSVVAFLFHQIPIWLGILDIWMDFRTPRPGAPARPAEDDDSFF